MGAFNTVLYQLSPRRRPQIQLELLDLSAVLDYSSFASNPMRGVEWVKGNDDSLSHMSAQDCLRRLALAVYNQPLLLTVDAAKGAVAKSVTRFGPASALSDILQPI